MNLTFLVYVHFMKDESLSQLLFAKQLRTDTKRESIFHVEQLLKSRKFDLLTYLLMRLMEYHQ